jgi:Tfp pilus assembly protein PilN
MKAINLLPPDLRGTPKSATQKAAVTPEVPGGIGAFVVLGALAACVVALAAYVLTTNTVKDRQAQLEAATAHAEATRQRVDQLKPYADFQAMAETRIQTVKDLAASRFDWEQALRDISRVVPGDVTLTELNGTISSAAGGGSGLRGAIAAPAIELKGCTSTQKQVATLLSRLRNVDGATRVSLNKSTKPDRQTMGGASPIADGATGTCSGKRPPEFELVMFFEGAEVPETVEDITVQPGAGEEANASGDGSTESTGTSTETGTTTPDDTATPESTPQGGTAQ